MAIVACNYVIITTILELTAAVVTTAFISIPTCADEATNCVITVCIEVTGVVSSRTFINVCQGRIIMTFIEYYV